MATDASRIEIQVGMSLTAADVLLDQMLANEGRFRDFVIQVEMDVFRLVTTGDMRPESYKVAALLDAMYDRLKRLEPFP